MMHIAPHRGTTSPLVVPSSSEKVVARKRWGREQLGIRVADPARRLLKGRGVHIGAERAPKVARRALHCVVVNAARLGAGRHGLCQRKCGGARIFQGHGGFAPASEFLPTAACSQAVRARPGLTRTYRWTSA